MDKPLKELAFSHFMEKKLYAIFLNLVVIWMLHYFLHLPGNFNTKITTHYGLQIDWDNTQ